jgi:hypothetical protein
MVIGMEMRSVNYSDNTPSFPMEIEKMVWFAAIDRIMIKMEIRISF